MTVLKCLKSLWIKIRPYTSKQMLCGLSFYMGFAHTKSLTIFSKSEYRRAVASEIEENCPILPILFVFADE